MISLRSSWVAREVGEALAQGPAGEFHGIRGLRQGPQVLLAGVPGGGDVSERLRPVSQMQVGAVRRWQGGRDGPGPLAAVGSRGGVRVCVCGAGYLAEPLAEDSPRGPV